MPTHLIATTEVTISGKLPEAMSRKIRPVKVSLITSESACKNLFKLLETLLHQSHTIITNPLS